MKLTLRYLLAYMDDILRPADAREVGRSLAENKAAGDLVTRVRSVIRMRRLSAPDPLADDAGRDANEVAEYLDNLMSPQEIRDFEQRCLESDESLAEVGASHQILTLILGGGLQTPESTRQRLKTLAYAIPDETETAARKGVANDRLSPDDLVPPLEMRNSKTSWQQVAAVLGVILLMGSWAYSILTDPSFRYQNEGVTESRRTTIPANGELDAVPALADADADDDSDSAAETKPATTAGPQRPAGSAATTPPGDSMTANGQNGKGPGKPSANGIDPEPVPLPDLNLDTPNTTAPPAMASTENGERPATPSGVPETGEDPDTEIAMAPNPVIPDGVGQPAGKAVDPPQPTVKDNPAPLTMTPVCFEPGIQFASSDAVLFVSSDDPNVAKMAQTEQKIDAGDFLLTPRFGLTRFKMGDRGATWQMREMTAVRILGSDSESCMGWQIDQGQLLISFPSPDPTAAPVRLRLNIFDQTWWLELPTKPTSLALSVRPQFPTHFEQLPAPGPAIAEIWVDGAPFRLRSADSDWKEVAEYAKLLPAAAVPEDDEAAAELANAILPAAGPAYPQWAVSPAVEMTTSQGRDQREFVKAVELSNNVWLDLQGVANNPNARVAALAADALALGQRLPALVAVLAHSPHEESRTAAIAGLRYWLLRDADNRTILQEELNRTFNADTAFLVYRLLWGFDENDGRDPDMSRQLVNGLRHDHVAVRELAIYWIYQLTGQKQNYRPLAPVNTREQGVSSWERHLSRVGALLPPVE